MIGVDLIGQIRMPFVRAYFRETQELVCGLNEAATRQEE
jgi:hypothetical protein